MDRNLPIEAKKDNFFSRLINHIKTFFGSNEKVEFEESASEAITSINELYKVDTIDEQKVVKEINRKNKIEEIIKIVEENPEILDTLNISRLELIDSYYSEKIVEYKRKVESYNNV